MISRQRQQGVALITAVLIVALVAATAVAMASRQQFDIRRTSNIFDSDQAWLATLGGEDYARNVLAVDENLDVDHLGENWAQPVTFPFEGMVLSGQIEDMQGRYNLNNLVENGEASDKDLSRFKRLLTLLELDEGLADAIVDWIDTGFEPRPINGAEDDYYMLQDPPYRAANRLMASPSELLLVKGVDKDIYQTLAPFVSALPERTVINVNTASAQLLAVVAGKTMLADGETLVEARGEEGFANFDQFKNQPLLKDLGENELSKDDVVFKSEYFLLNAVAEFDQAHSQLFSLLSRDEKGQTRVVMHSRGAY